MALDFALTDEQKLVQTSVRTMLQKYIPRRAEFRQMNAERKFPANDTFAPRCSRPTGSTVDGEPGKSLLSP